LRIVRRLLIITGVVALSLYLISWATRGVGKYRQWEREVIAQFNSKNAEYLIRKYSSSIKNHPFEGGLYYKRAMIYMLWAGKTREKNLYLARMKEALDNLLASEVLLRGKKLHLLYRKMIALYELKNYSEALKIAKILYRKKYMPSSTWNYLVSSLEALGKTEEAIDFSLKSPEILKKVENLKVSSHLCSHLIKLGKFEDAERILMIMLTSKSEKVRVKAMKLLGWLCYERGNLNEAEKFFRRALELEKTGENYWLLGRILQLEGKAEGEYYLKLAEKYGYRGGKVEVQP